jgi:transcriptional regulator with XRE-family HTH domain
MGERGPTPVPAQAAKVAGVSAKLAGVDRRTAQFEHRSSAEETSAPMRKLAPMKQDRTDQPFRDAVPSLLAERGMSLRELGRRLGMDATHLSRVRRGRKRLSPDLPRQVALSLGLPADYFPETREAAILDAVRQDPLLRETIYEQVLAANRGTRRKRT